MKNLNFYSIFDFLLIPVKTFVFKYLLILNMISNFGVSIYFHDVFSIFSIITLAAFTAYLETVLCISIRIKFLKLSLFIFLAIFHNILIAIDYYLIFHFQMPIGQDAIDVLADTNSVEAQNFMMTYLSFHVVLVWVIAIVVLNVAVIWISNHLRGKITHWISLFSSFMGIGLMVICALNFVLYRNGMSIPQYQTWSRVGYSLYVCYQQVLVNKELHNVCQNVQAVSVLEEKPTIVVVIGESFSIYHSSLYGYNKQTNPLLDERKAKGELYVYEDVISVACATHGAMESIFSLDSLGVGWEWMPLFPACFKAVGYKTYMYDNQYFVGNGVNFMSDKDLSTILFDFRNKKRYRYDMEMVKTIDVQDSPSLYVIHLWGQHYTYKDRYPNQFRYFESTDYDQNRWSKEQREIIAHYDNATRYNDFVINEIIEKFKNHNSCVVYFSDHGEEVYELGDFIGHGNAEHSRDIRYQIRVPLMVWTSPFFKRSDIKEELQKSVHLPIMTDDISHFLLDIAGIQTRYFRPTRSFINSQYNISKPRIVLNSIDFDKKTNAN